MKYLSMLIILFWTIIPASGKELKLLMIGNSFSRDAVCYLPDVISSVKGCKLKLVCAMIPSANWESLLNGIEKGVNTSARPFRLIYRLPGEPQKNWWRPRGYDKLDRIIKSDNWDIISLHSFRPVPFQPAADKVINYVKKLAPKAEIVIQETWSFNIMDKRVSPPKPAWGVTQAQMSQKLSASYRKLSKKHNLRLVPVGRGVDIYRKNTPVKFKPCTPVERKKFKYPQLPDFRGEAVGFPIWLRKKNGTKKLHFDTLHLNDQGHYLQACIWFAFLYDRKVSEIKFQPKKMEQEIAQYVRDSAQQAINRN